ncbi:hypothetical protein [Microvirga roseola]|uniref:hypothetical protein n=1 Tax=Microvirga roseola TaxID=2883126 RepID=UPI001E41110A|nr:hypothetical protein [Microvirga roseola]
MLTVLIRVKQGPEALAVTLSALVPAVAAGLVGDAVVLAAKPDDVVTQVADAAGATLIVTEDPSWRPGAQAARRDWLLCLDDGDIPQEGWIRVLERFVGLGKPEKGLARLRRHRSGLLEAALGAVMGLIPQSSVRAGDLVHRRVLLDEVKARAPVRLSATIERDPVFG